MMKHNGKEDKKNIYVCVCVCVCITESLCCTSEISIANQLYVNKKPNQKKKTPNQAKHTYWNFQLMDSKMLI